VQRKESVVKRIVLAFACATVLITSGCFFNPSSGPATSHPSPNAYKSVKSEVPVHIPSTTMAPKLLDLSGPPHFLSSFDGGTDHKMQRPMGVCASNGDIYVADAVARCVEAFGPNGEFKTTIGRAQLVTPVSVAVNPKNSQLYVVDMRLRQISRFSATGQYLGTFDPNLPQSARPKFDTHGIEWAPTAIAFADDGNMYVTDTLADQRLLIFNSEGSFRRVVGSAGHVAAPDGTPMLFQSPNNVACHDGLVFVADSGNGRVQIFSEDGNFSGILPTNGFPTGIAFGSSSSGQGGFRSLIVDELSGDCEVFDSHDNPQFKFGEQGAADGQFSSPSAAAAYDGKLYIADTANSRVQVWGP
jgi:DNA-binding beta-propeller fold protein YncE